MTETHVRYVVVDASPTNVRVLMVAADGSYRVAQADQSQVVSAADRERYSQVARRVAARPPNARRQIGVYPNRESFIRAVRQRIAQEYPLPPAPLGSENVVTRVPLGQSRGVNRRGLSRRLTMRPPPLSRDRPTPADPEGEEGERSLFDIVVDWIVPQSRRNRARMIDEATRARVRVRNGRLYELDETGAEASRLTFDTAESNRNYYVVGDLILPGRQRLDRLAQIPPFTQLAQPDDVDSQMDAGAILAEVFGLGRSADVQYAFKIAAILGDGASARIRVEPLVIFDGSTNHAVQMEPVLTWNMEQLTRKFHQASIWGTLLRAVEIGGVVTEIALTPLTGPVRAVGRRIAGRIGRRMVRGAFRVVSRRVIRWLLKFMKSKLRQIIVAAGRSFAGDLLRQYRQDQLQGMVRGEPPPNLKLDYERAARAAIISAVQESLGHHVARLFRDAHTGNTMSSRARQEISRRLSSSNEADALAAANDFDTLTRLLDNSPSLKWQFSARLDRALISTVQSLTEETLK
ncbi:MAG: hypothetical protein AAFO63_13575, partial [Pseudomonadota bacterium]